VLPLPTVNEDRGPEKDSDEHHLDGVLHALQPRAPIMSPTLADPQPLPNAVRVPRVHGHVSVHVEYRAASTGTP